MKKLLLILLVISCGLFLKAQTSGGPDAYGYTWKSSSHTTNPPAYAWVDITTKGTEVNGLLDDNVVGPFPVPSGFQFYWYPITQFWIGSNGYINFNGANMASPFPASIPLTSGGNDWIGPNLSDLNFAGSSNNAECWYYTNNDSVVVSYINVPYWVNASPPYSGSNTFQIVISSIDSSITFNYKTMNAGSATTPIDNAVGIENVTGALGLQSRIDNVPGNTSTIRYYYPSNVTYSVTDAGVNWNNNQEDGGFFIPVSNNPVSFQANVKNYGNQNIGSFTITDTIYSGTNPTSNGSATISSLAAGDDSTFSFSNVFIAQFPGIFKFASRIQGVTGDLVAVNNRRVQKMIAVNTSSSTYNLDYSDGVPDGAALNWSGGNGGIAVYIEPPTYPAKIDGSRFYISSNSTTSPAGFSAMIFDDSGPNNSPGQLLDSVYVSPSSVSVGGYNVVPPQDTNLTINSGGVYVVWYMGGPDISLARDLTPPSSARSFEILGTGWADYRAKLTEDFLMGLVIKTLPIPEANFSVDYTQSPAIAFTDLSTNNPTKWHWDFDNNGDTSNVQHPGYIYTANGTYNVCLTATNSYGSHTKCKNVIISTISNIGVDEFGDGYNVFVYPNPASTSAKILLPEDFKNANFKVFNIVGEKMNVDFSIYGDELEFITDKLSPGVYVLELQSEKNNNKVLRTKFVVE